jgi:intracellular septation protein
LHQLCIHRLRGALIAAQANTTRHTISCKACDLTPQCHAADPDAMKLLFDFFPILLFFITYKVASTRAADAAAFTTQHLSFVVAGGVVSATEAPVLLATVVVILATLLQVGWVMARGKKVEPMLWVSLALIVVLGGLTIWLRSETFIKWKPTLLYAAMATSFAVAHVVWRKNLLRSVLGAQIKMPDAIWTRMLFWWVAFFSAMAVLNLWVAYNFPTETWVNFKVFGLIGLTFAFTLGQGLVLAKHMQEPSDDASQAENTKGTKP